MPAQPSENALLITRCVCSDTTFRKMKEIAAENGCETVEEIQQHVPMAQDCGLCILYIQRMLRTGETEFDALEGLGGDWGL